MVGETKCGEKEQKRGLVHNKKEIFNTKLKIVCVEEMRRHMKSMPNRLKRHKKEKNLKNSIRRSLSNKLIKILSNFKFVISMTVFLFGR